MSGPHVEGRWTMVTSLPSQPEVNSTEYLDDLKYFKRKLDASKQPNNKRLEEQIKLMEDALVSHVLSRD